MLLTDIERMLEELAFWSTRFVNLFLDTHKHLLPETRNRRHTSRMRLTHRLLYFLRIGVHNQSGSLRQTEDFPSFLKYMSKWQKVQYPIILIDRHALTIGNHCRMILATRQNDAFRVTRCTTSIKNISDVIH